MLAGERNMFLPSSSPSAATALYRSNAKALMEGDAGESVRLPCAGALPAGESGASIGNCSVFGFKRQAPHIQNLKILRHAMYARLCEFPARRAWRPLPLPLPRRSRYSASRM